MMLTVYFVATFLYAAKAQTAGRCVPVGTCTAGTVIDPRIVSPSQIPCPSGQQLCTGIGESPLPCGTNSGNVGTGYGSAAYGAYPWQAYIEDQTGYIGSGVLIDKKHVLTAAHKVQNNIFTPFYVKVYMGVYDNKLATTVQSSVAARIISHPEYSGRNVTLMRGDLAIIRLSTSILTSLKNNIMTACLPSSGQSYAGRQCLVSGWGQTDYAAANAPTTGPIQVTLPIVSYPTCRNSMLRPDVLGSNTDAYLDPNGEICAGGQARQDACTQDGGSPLVCPVNGQYFAVGLVLWGKGCGSQGVYGVYLNLSWYKQWIDGTVSALDAGTI